MVLYVYYSLPFDLSILPIDLEIDALMTTLHARIWYARGQLLNLIDHFYRTQKSTKGHGIGKAKRKEIALRYYEQIKKKDLSTWDKAGEIRDMWLKDTPPERHNEVPSQRTIFNYLREEGEH